MFHSSCADIFYSLISHCFVYVFSFFLRTGSTQFHISRLNIIDETRIRSTLRPVEFALKSVMFDSNVHAERIVLIGNALPNYFKRIGQIVKFVRCIIYIYILDTIISESMYVYIYIYTYINFIKMVPIYCPVVRVFGENF